MPDDTADREVGRLRAATHGADEMSRVAVGGLTRNEHNFLILSLLKTTLACWLRLTQAGRARFLRKRHWLLSVPAASAAQLLYRFHATP